MLTQTHIIGQDYSVYYDLVAVVCVLFLGMLACSIWLTHRKRSAQFIALSWSGFLALAALGTLCIVLFIHVERSVWRDSCARLVASYADIVDRLDHWKTIPGNPERFSEWSHPVIPLTEPQSLDCEMDTTNSSDRLATPECLIAHWQTEMPLDAKPLHVQRRNQWAVAALTGDGEAFDRCTKQIVVRWNPVPDATTYRLQWGEYHAERTEWMTVYTGAKPACILTAPDGINIALRVRAEDGTPEDDPEFNKIIDILDSPVRADRLIGYAYTLRVVDQDWAQFIAAPISDANHNHMIDASEVPNDIGELFKVTPLFRYVLENKVRALDLNTSVDDWGRWLTIAEPLWTPNGEIDGILGVDFNVDLVRWKMFTERIYPLCLFVLITCLYFGSVLSISSLQIKERAIRKLAAGLRETNVKLTEAKQAAERALQAKTLFLTNMSHEFRTPLNAILGFTEILAQRTQKCAAEEQSFCAEAVKHIRESGQNLLEMVENVLNVAAMDGDQTLSLKVVPVDFRNLIAGVADMMQSRAESKSLSLTVTEEQKIPDWIGSDPERLRQVLIHLLGNAIKFTQEGGIAIRYGVSTEPNMLYVAVSDTGIGIASGKFDSIFKPFSQFDPSSTRRYGGAGIGLSVAMQAAEMLNGNIAVESHLEQGSTFTFIFPGLPVEPPNPSGDRL